eukprot:1148812-Pelagomonas_calceolata.AAC.3
MAVKTERSQTQLSHLAAFFWPMDKLIGLNFLEENGKLLWFIVVACINGLVLDMASKLVYRQIEKQNGKENRHLKTAHANSSASGS